MRKFVKFLYGLKQAPKQWHQNLTKLYLLVDSINESDKYIYSKFNEGKGVIIYLYVEDMLIFGIDLKKVKVTKFLFSNKFDMKDVGEADVISGIKISRDKNNIMLFQLHYVEKILNKFNQNDCVPTSMPLNLKISYVKNERNPIS